MMKCNKCNRTMTVDTDTNEAYCGVCNHATLIDISSFQGSIVTPDDYDDDHEDDGYADEAEVRGVIRRALRTSRGDDNTETITLDAMRAMRNELANLSVANGGGVQFTDDGELVPRQFYRSIEDNDEIPE